MTIALSQSSGRHSNVCYAGSLSNMALDLKQTRLAQIQELSLRIADLERSHKLNQSPTTQLTLSDARLRLLHLFEQKTLSIRDKTKQFYVEANKK